MEIDEARKNKRLKTIKRLQIITAIFIIVSLYLIVWDLVRLFQNFEKPTEKVNCFGVSKNPEINNVLWFLARLFASQIEMVTLIFNYWKTYSLTLKRTTSLALSF